MITAVEVSKKIIITISDTTHEWYKLERCKYRDDNWLIYTEDGFVARDDDSIPVRVNGDTIDNSNIENTLYMYRYSDYDDESHSDYNYSSWVRVGNTESIGYTFNNYIIPCGQWGEIVTADDMRFTYLWGVDLKSANGDSISDDQINYFINASAESIARQLNITIKKKKLRYNPKERGLKKTIDYDKEEGVYDFKYSRIARYGIIKTRERPIIKLHKLELLRRMIGSKDLKDTTVVDKTKGILKLMEKPVRPSDTSDRIATAINSYGKDTYSTNLFYAIDYDAGFETSDDIPDDLREVIAKNAAVSMLNIIGDGLMSGFSSSSLSMDGLSESFSSTQSATSAYFGARIKEYKDDIQNYLKDSKNKFGSMVIGSL
ncbi:MAG: hypothetical protein ACRC4W_00125 [Treponemataceae bacterium]